MVTSTTFENLPRWLTRQVTNPAMLRRIEARFDKLYLDRPRYDHPKLQWHIEANILPGLALYQVLLEDGLTLEEARDEVMRVMRASFVEENRFRMGLIKHLPFGFGLLRRLVKRTMKHDFPEPGFSTVWVENSPDRIAFYMTRCLYLNTLTHYGAPELTPAFCANDDAEFALLEPAIHFERAGTLGKGAPACDFCFKPGSTSQTSPSLN
jgi:hypothetical protein